MPPEASWRPESGLNFMETSTSVNGPAGATMTLNSFFVARCTSTFLPLGAPAISSTVHCPSTVDQPWTPLVSKSNFSSGTLPGIFSSSAASGSWGHGPLINAAPANVNLKIVRRETFMRPPRPLRNVAASSQSSYQTSDSSGRHARLQLIELLGHRLPLCAFHECHVGDGVPLLHGRHDADNAVSFVFLDRLGGGRPQRPLGLGHGFALLLGVREIVSLGDRLRFGDLAGLVVDDHFGEVGALHRVDRQLQLAVLHLVLRRDRLAFLRAGGESTFQWNLGVL